MARTSPRSVLITGASSGLGWALALAYAEPGRRLFLCGRDEGRLKAVVALARARGAKAEGFAADVTDGPAMAGLIEGVGPLDLVIANAGISGGPGGTEGESEARTRAIFAVNVQGVLNTVLPAVAGMRQRHSGQIAVMASLAGFRGLPTAPAYSASKAAVRAWGEGLRGHLAADGIGVTVICPGFIRTPLTAVNDFPMPFLMEPEKAAAIIKAGIVANRARVAFPWPLAWAAKLAAALPPAWLDPVLSRLPRKA